MKSKWYKSARGVLFNLNTLDEIYFMSLPEEEEMRFMVFGMDGDEDIALEFFKTEEEAKAFIDILYNDYLRG